MGITSGPDHKDLALFIDYCAVH